MVAKWSLKILNAVFISYHNEMEETIAELLLVNTQAQLKTSGYL